MAFRWMFSAEYPQYMLLSHHHDDFASKVSKTPNRRLRPWQSVLALSAIFLCSNTLSYYCGRYGKSEFDSGMLSETYIPPKVSMGKIQPIDAMDRSRGEGRTSF